jgi:hypothetical protein
MATLGERRRIRLLATRLIDGGVCRLRVGRRPVDRSQGRPERAVEAISVPVRIRASDGERAQEQAGGPHRRAR